MMSMDFLAACSYRDRTASGIGEDAMAKMKAAPACGCPVAAFQKMISGKYKLRSSGI